MAENKNTAAETAAETAETQEHTEEVTEAVETQSPATEKGIDAEPPAEQQTVSAEPAAAAETPTPETAETGGASGPAVETSEPGGASGSDATDPAATEETPQTAPEEPAIPDDEQEISYHAVEKEGTVTAIWEMQGRKHIRTIDPRSNEGKKILSLFETAV